MAKIDLKKVLKRIKPTERDIAEEKKKVEELKEKISSFKPDSVVGITLAGSMSRNTHLKGDNDIDLFVMFDKSVPRTQFEKEGLAVAKKVFRGHPWEMVYSEHPYIRGVIDGFQVEIVPSYKIDSTEELQSAVDRTPFHAKYIETHLSDSQKDQVRLLKKFLKGIKAYGADLKTMSFPGLITELLIIQYGTFLNTINNVASWRKGEVIDLEKHYPSSDAAMKRFDNTWFVVVDPTDRKRNVASAVSFNQYARFIAASRAYIKKPGEKFFFGRTVKPWPNAKVKRFLDQKEFVGIEMAYPKKFVPDVMWGQLKRLRKKTSNLLKEHGFAIKRTDEWTDEEKRMVVFVELENVVIQKLTKRVGPEVTALEHSDKFLKSHEKPVSGPRIEDGRWVLDVERAYWDAKMLLRDLLTDLKRNSKQGLKQAARKSKVLDEKQMLALYSKDKKFREYFTVFLEAKEEFLNY